MNIPAWNAGSLIAFLALTIWYHAYGEAWWAERQKKWEEQRQLCYACGRPTENCACIVFTPYDDEKDGDD